MKGWQKFLIEWVLFPLMRAVGEKAVNEIREKKDTAKTDGQ